MKANFWLSVLTDLQNRGARDILIASVDGQRGFPDAIQSVFPDTIVQLCIVHQIRDSIKYVGSKHQKEFLKDLKRVYGVVCKDAAETELLNLEEKWREKYPIVIRSWQDNWEKLTEYFQFTSDIRRMIYMTNTVEGYHRQIRKVTKNMYYYGLKLHTVAFQRKGTIPSPEILILSSAEENDLTVLKREAADTLENRYVFADKIYSDFSFWEQKYQEKGVTMLTPVKAIKGEHTSITQRMKAARDLFSTAVSKVRQPIESFFNWLNERTNIQRVMKVRSTSGLLAHAMGKIAIAFIYLIF